MLVERKPVDKSQVDSLVARIKHANNSGNNDVCPGYVAWSVSRHSHCGLLVRHSTGGKNTVPFVFIRCGKNTANAVLDRLESVSTLCVLPERF